MSVATIEFKSGVQVKPSHGLAHVWVMLDVACETAPILGKDRVVVTEAYRLPRRPDDAHTWCLAFDLRIHNIQHETAPGREAEAWEWVGRMRAWFSDPRYQFDVHGEGSNAHIHMEFDPR